MCCGPHKTSNVGWGRQSSWAGSAVFLTLTLVLLFPSSGELPEALTRQVLQVRRVAEEELPAAAAGGARHPACPPVPVAGRGAASGRGSQGAASPPHLLAQPAAPSAASVPRSHRPPGMNHDWPAPFVISRGETGETRPSPSPSVPEPRSGAAGRHHAAPAPTKQLTQARRGWRRRRWPRGVLLSGWGGGLFRFPGLSRFPRAPSIFQALYLQRDSWALELFLLPGAA